MDSSSETTYLREAEYYPDKNTNIELRVLILEQIYKELGLPNMENPAVVVLGVGRGADIQAIHKLKPDASFLAAVDAFPSPDQINAGSASIPIQRSEIVRFLSDERNKALLSKATVFVGTRIGSQALMGAIRSLPQEGQYIGIFSTDDFVSKGSIEMLQSQRPDLEITPKGSELSGGGEDVFLIRRREPSIPNA